MRRWLWIILAAELLLLGVAEKCAFEPALADTLQDTNPADIQAWYRSLDNHIGGSCCGEGDGYPAAIDVGAVAFVSVQGGQIISVYCVVLQPAGV